MDDEPTFSLSRWMTARGKVHRPHRGWGGAVSCRLQVRPGNKLVLEKLGFPECSLKGGGPVAILTQLSPFQSGLLGSLLQPRLLPDFLPLCAPATLNYFEFPEGSCSVTSRPWHRLFAVAAHSSTPTPLSLAGPPSAGPSVTSSLSGLPCKLLWAPWDSSFAPSSPFRVTACLLSAIHTGL